MTCERCSGSGLVTCSRCAGAGVLGRGNLVTRKFSYSQEWEYQLSGLAKNEFKNGLKGKHFRPVEGDLVSNEFQSPRKPETVLERKGVHTYNVLSREYSYKEKQFHRNQITSSGNMKCVASGSALLPG